MAVRKEVEHKHIQWFVIGALVEWNNITETVEEGEILDGFIADGANIVIGYLNGTRRLDGTVHDQICIVAHEAAKVFNVEGLRHG